MSLDLIARKLASRQDTTTATPPKLRALQRSLGIADMPASLPEQPFESATLRALVAAIESEHQQAIAEQAARMAEILRQRAPTPVPLPVQAPALPPVLDRQPQTMVIRRDGLGVLLGVEHKDANGNVLLAGTVSKRNRDNQMSEMTYTTPHGDQCRAKITRGPNGLIYSVKYSEVA